VIVLDASALLAYFRRERGSDIVASVLAESIVSTVNLAEVLSKAVERGEDAAAIHRDIRALGVVIVPFDEEQALRAALLRRITTPKGLSLGDRTCLALALLNDCEALTSDTKWSGLPHGAKVRQIR
jgi:PIN domain nuclease of toxin-antitoxin system